MNASKAEAHTANAVPPCRRQRRAEPGPAAVRYQLQQVAEGLSLDAIVLADDLGRVLAQAGNPRLSHLLADAAMWAMQGVDDFTIERVQHNYPDIEPNDLVAESVAVPGADGTRLIAAGKSFALRVGVEHAIAGIRRICTSWKAKAPTWQATVQSDEPADRQMASDGAIDDHGSGVRWALSPR